MLTSSDNSKVKETETLHRIGLDHMTLEDMLFKPHLHSFKYGQALNIKESDMRNHRKTHKCIAGNMRLFLSMHTSSMEYYLYIKAKNFMYNLT